MLCSRGHPQPLTLGVNQAQGPPKGSSQEQKEKDLQAELETSCNIQLRDPPRTPASYRVGPRPFMEAGLEIVTPSSGQDRVPIHDRTESPWAEEMWVNIPSEASWGH